MTTVKCPKCSNPLVEDVVSHRLGDDEDKVYQCRLCNTEFGVLKNGKPDWWKPIEFSKS
jgi:hypothetical protein